MSYESLSSRLQSCYSPPFLHADTFYLTVAGLGGEPEYDQRFSGWAKDLDKLLHEVEPHAKIKTLYGADATKANVEAYLREVAKQCQARRFADPDDDRPRHATTSSTTNLICLGRT